MRIIGIDPGSAGGMVCLLSDAVGPDHCKLDRTERDIADCLRDWGRDPCFAYLERVWASRGSGNRTMGAATMFTFGANYGFLRGLLIALEIPFEEVLPLAWQKTFSLKRVDKSESDTDKKNRHKAKAQQLFPQVKVTHAIADALLIAEHGRRLRVFDALTAEQREVAREILAASAPGEEIETAEAGKSTTEHWRLYMTPSPRMRAKGG